MDRAKVVPRPLPFHLLQEITDSFSEDRNLVPGVLKDGEKIAVKKLHSMPGLNDKQFQREYLNLAGLQHQNIVRLVGYCHETRGEYVEYNGKMIFAENQHMALCFEYMHNGSLDNCLQDESNGHDWHTRYTIIKGICKGLKYLHEELEPPVYHLDLKPANILLDEKMLPKIAYFGLSKLFGDERTRISATPIGTIGYLPPEYINQNLVSNKLDIFSMGVIIIKMMTGPAGYSRSAEMSTQDFIELVHGKWRNRLQRTSVGVTESYAEQVKTCIKIALRCVDADRHKRPNIGDIIDELNETEIATQFSQALTIDPVSTSVGEQMCPRMFAKNELVDAPPIKENELLNVHSRQLLFPFFEPNKSISCPLRLSNNTDYNVAFRILPKLPESYMDGLSELNGIVPPRSTRTYLVSMEKQPPANLDEFAATLESCIAHEGIADVDDNFLQEVVELTVGNRVHEVTLMATICDPAGEKMTSEPIRSGITKVICRVHPGGELTQIDVHPTEPWILASYHGGGITIWNYETQERVTALKILTDTDKIRCAKFIARKNWFLAGDWYGWINVRACVTNDEVKKFKAHDNVIISLAVHPSDPLLLSSSIDHYIKLSNWEANWKCIRRLKAHSGNVEKVMFNPMDSNSFASVGLEVKIWKTSSPLPVTILDCHQQDQLTVDYFHPGGDRQYMVTGSLSGNARIWDLKTNTCIRQINALQSGYSRNVGVLDCFADRQLLITTLEGNVISVYNFNTDGHENSIDFKLGMVCNFAYIKDIKSVAIGFNGGIAMMEIN